MTKSVNNHIISFRSRLKCLDEDAHKAVWLGKEPAIFGKKVDIIRKKLAALITAAAKQSTPLTGTTVEKETTRASLETAAHNLGRMVVLYAEDHQNEVLAHKFDLTPTQWQRFRDETLLERAGLLTTECEAIMAKDPAEATDYNLTSTILTEYSEVVEKFKNCITSPHDGIAHRHTLTTSLPDQVRALKELFGQLEDILPQCKTPEGQTFAAEFLATSPVINRGTRHRRSSDEEDEMEDKEETNADKAKNPKKPELEEPTSQNPSTIPPASGDA